MKRVLLCVLCLALLLSGCTQTGASPSTATFAGLTIEEYKLSKDSEGGLWEAGKVLVDHPEISEKRKQWRETPWPFTAGTASETGLMLLHSPVRVGDSVVYARLNSDFEVEIVRANQVAYVYRNPRTKQMAVFEAMVQGLTDWDGKWVLETFEEEVIVEGQSLNEQLGYPEMFEFHIIAGKPFFFFRQNGKVRISYDGQVLPVEYDKVHHYGCCDSVAYNPQASDRMISFFALRGDQWYFVDIGNYS